MKRKRKTPAARGKPRGLVDFSAILARLALQASDGLDHIGLRFGRCLMDGGVRVSMH